MVAFTALNGGRRQIWYRVLARGVSVQVTSDDSDKEQPRWAPDSMTILYLKVSDDLGGEGTLHEVLITGGPSRPIAQAQSGGDISHDGQWIATFQASGETTRLVVLRRDGSFVREVARRIPERGSAWTPRWSPDDQSIAYVDLGAGAFETRLNVVPAAGGPLRALVSGRIVRGLSWLPDGSGMLYASEESTLRYPPTSLLRVSRLADPDNTSQQLSYGMDSLTNPDVHASGLLLATRTTMRSALWKVPVAGTAAENTAQARQLTNETSQVQTPSASKDGQVVYLSDSGGHGNLWVIDADGSGRRQLTFETEPDVGVGVPVWSPDGTMIVYLRTAPGKQEQFLIRPDGTERRLLVDRGIAAAWSPDSQWLYYAAPRSAGSDETCIWKIQIRDRVKQMVRCNAIRPMPGPDGTLFFETLLTSTNGAFDSELRKANPENAEASTLLGRTGSREVSYDSRLSAGTALSPDGRWLASALLTRATANLWKRPTAGGEKQPVTNFHDNATWIVRQVAWSHDSRFLYAAIANVDTDIISMAGLIRPAGKEK
jgi:Tol biopolymer transport system component